MSDSFRYHKQCEDLKIINVFFADDLFLFARGDVASAMVIMESLNEFQHVSGLIPSIPKSTAFFGNVVNHVKVGILSIMPFSEGELPVKYLGVPLILSRLWNKDCKILVEKARNHIGDWKNKSLSFAGRLQLCKSVISAMQVYWASILVIPKGITSDIQQLTCGFLWCNGDYKRGKVKVAWESICLPKSEGGHGLRSLEGWRKILQLREQVRPFIWAVMGNWHKTSLWHDHWCTQSMLSHHLSLRDTARDGYNLRTCVSDLVVHGGWNWHSTWLAKAPILVSIPTPVLDYISQDCMKWRDTNGNFSEFSVRCAWEALRLSSNEVLWFRLVWFSHCIPRHAFYLWLVMRRCLKTQDLLKPWDVVPNTDISLYVRTFAGMNSVNLTLADIMLWCQLLSNKRTVKGVVGKLIFAAASYYVWLERNNRLFKSIRRQPEELCDLIIVTVCLKLLTFKFNNTAKVESLLSL
ncbi:putative reverse transcriptase domain, reverse transcriptase zinc-binding domain protein [Tanacetum coccineum]